MKQKMVGIILLLFMIPLMIVWGKEGKTELVGSLKQEHVLLQEPDTYQMFYLKFEKGLDTNNIEELLKDQTILKMSPRINPIYRDKISTFYYHIGSGTMNYQISQFINYYAQKLENNGFKSDALKARTSGVAIDVVMVYMSNQNMYQFLQTHPTVLYSTNDQMFQTLQEGSI